MGHQAGVLISGLRVCAFGGDIVNRLSVLALIACDHIHGLLDQVEIKVLVAEGWGEVEVPVDKGLAAGVEESIDVRLVPTSLFDWLKLAIEIVQPLADVSLIGFERVIPRWIIETQEGPLYG